jgi:transcriptional regulator
MYIPASNRIDDHQKAFDLIDAYGFATVVTSRNGVPWASHLPVLLDRAEGGSGALRSHMARANEQWRHFDSGQEVLCIFQGPHSYISPSWYASKVAVPTWNYATVHVYGFPSVEADPDGLRKIVDDTTNKYEKNFDKPWTMRLPGSTIDSLMGAIVGFHIKISRSEAKFKFGQNRSEEDQEAMLDALESSKKADARALAAFMRSERARTEQTGCTEPGDGVSVPSRTPMAPGR